MALRLGRSIIWFQDPVSRPKFNNGNPRYCLHTVANLLEVKLPAKQNRGQELNNLMRYSEIIEESFIGSFKNTIAMLALASSTFGSLNINPASANNATQTSMNYDKELTQVGRDAIKNLPTAIQKKVGDVNTIYFVDGVPEGGSENAVCQVAKGSRIVYVNPKYRKTFLDGAADQLTAHEATHIAQSNMSQEMQNRFPKTVNDGNENDQYGSTLDGNVWKSLVNARKQGDRMWDHSREEQAMIVQQRTAAQHDLNSFLKLGRTDDAMKDAISLQKQKIAIYDQYIEDYE